MPSDRREQFAEIQETVSVLIERVERFENLQIRGAQVDVLFVKDDIVGEAQLSIASAVHDILSSQLFDAQSGHVEIARERFHLIVVGLAIVQRIFVKALHRCAHSFLFLKKQELTKKKTFAS